MPKRQRTANQDVASGAPSYFSLPLASRRPRNAHDVQATTQTTPGDRNPLARRDPSGLTAYQRHKVMMTDYLKYYHKGALPSQSAANNVTDLDALKSAHKFLRTDSDNEAPTTWESRVAQKYYSKLFKEYTLADLSRYRTSQIALRWRTRAEVVAGKGQFECANLACNIREDLRSWEVNFAYTEAGEAKNALVKVRLCLKCSYKLNYRKIKEKRREERDHRRVQRIAREEAAAAEEKAAAAEKDSKKRDADDFSEEKHESSSDDTDQEQGDRSSFDHETEVASLWSATRSKSTKEGADLDRDDLDALFADLFQ